MEEKRTTGAWVAVGAATLVLLSIGAYIGGYQYLCIDKLSGNAELRFYRYEWEARLFSPGAAIDSKIRGMEVEVTSKGSNFRRINLFSNPVPP